MFSLACNHQKAMNCCVLHINTDVSSSTEPALLHCRVSTVAQKGLLVF